MNPAELVSNRRRGNCFSFWLLDFPVFVFRSFSEKPEWAHQISGFREDDYSPFVPLYPSTAAHDLPAPSIASLRAISLFLQYVPLKGHMY
jgi:hypothetical protein